jgi:SP family galactose:H+ symporter-like MFS transporter
MNNSAFIEVSAVVSPARGMVVLTAAIAALGGLLFGYDTSLISGAMLFLRGDFHLTDVQLEFAVGVALAGALVGSAVAGYCADRWGRRTTLFATGVGFGVFALFSGLTTGLVTFSMARFFVGVCIGMASLVTPLFLAEMSPAKIRGALVSLNQLAITVGIAVAYVVDYKLAASQNWRWMFYQPRFFRLSFSSSGRVSCRKARDGWRGRDTATALCGASAD